MIAGQVLLGLGASLFGFAASVAMQVTLKHQYVAVMIALFFSFQLIGNAMGNAVSGSIWSNPEADTRVSWGLSPTIRTPPVQQRGGEC